MVEIARLTLLEAVRRRLVLAVVLLSLGFAVLFALGLWFLRDEIEGSAPPGGATMTLTTFAAVMTLLAFYALAFLAGIVALFTSVATVSGEIESGTMHAVAAKPIGRASVLLGKFAGYALLMASYVLLMGAAILASAQMVVGYSPPDPARALGLIVWIAWLLLALSLLGGTVLPTLANGVVIFLLYGLAWIAGLVEWIGHAAGSRAMVDLGIAVSLLIPSDALWRGASYYLQPVAMLAAQSVGPAGSVPFFSATPPAVPMLAWSAAYVVIALALATALFARRDL